ncbi:uncharacterized protein B0H18DRAFT_508206 [Fomitopsis serialis]|uniref:uncharacterized protein n=1 Tax=Fomitopsis serialis TaxID=139415 RepID=UPI00200845B1|nr:uncharacterized protein B0H18DRAFT_508206 [Neoantrodia serialis]KAH9922664.1 hypothetical protein B0H18DRAFT_508206 [Neoantrodia serialis]
MSNSTLFATCSFAAAALTRSSPAPCMSCFSSKGGHSAQALTPNISPAPAMAIRARRDTSRAQHQARALDDFLSPADLSHGAAQSLRFNAEKPVFSGARALARRASSLRPETTQMGTRFAAAMYIVSAIFPFIREHLLPQVHSACIIPYCIVAPVHGQPRRRSDHFWGNTRPLVSIEQAGVSGCA